MNPKINRKGYWLLLAATLSVLPFLLFAGYAIVQLVQSKQEDLRQQLIDRTQSTANAVAERLAVSAGALRALGNSDAALKGDLPAMYAQAKRFAQGMPEINSISLVTPDGMVQFLTPRPFGEKPFLAGDIEGLRTVFETGRPTVSGPFQSYIDKKLTITSVDVPVFRDGRVVYCLRAVFRNSSLNSLLAAQQLPIDWVASIVTRTGLLAARSRSPEKYVGEPAPQAVLDALANHPQGVFDGITKEGQTAKAVMVVLPGWDWYVALGVPSYQFEEPLRQAKLFLSVFGIATLVLGGILVGWAYSLMRDPSSSTPVHTSAPKRRLTNLWPSLVALLVAVLISAWSTQASQDALDQITSLNNKRQDIDKERRQLLELLSAYADIETGQRGFTITGDDAFLTHYRDALPKVGVLLSSLQSELVRMGISNVNWSDIAYFSSLRLESAARDIDMRRRLGTSAVQNAALLDQDKQTMDKLRFMLGRQEAQLEAETLRIDDVTTAQEQKTRQLQWLAQFGVGALVMFSVSIWLYERRRRYAVIDQLHTFNQMLEHRVNARTLELAKASARIQNFVRETEVVLDSERKRLSREVHDQIGQTFTGLKMIMRTLRPGSLAADQQQAMTLAIDTGIKVSRRIAAELRPPLLDDLGLKAALEHYLKSTFEPLDIAFDLQMQAHTQLAAHQKNQLFRIVQEACTNIIRHAQASQVDVIATVVNGALEVRIEDDGIGFDEARVRVNSLGLNGIEERAKLCGAIFTVEPRAERGTCVCIVFPAEALLPEAAS